MLRFIGLATALVTTCFAWSIAGAQESEFAGLIRSKTPDRPSYQVPQVVRHQAQVQASDGPTGDVASDAGYEEPRYEEPKIVRGRVRQTSAEVIYEDYAEPVYGDVGCGTEASCGIEPACGCEALGYACDGSCNSCDGNVSCDSMFGGCGGCGSCNACNSRLSFDPCQWFGSVELLLMWRVGDGLPPLVTTSDVATGSGVLNAPGTRVLFGGERVLDELTAGGRVTLGTWLDNSHCRSLVFRGWGAEQDSYQFASDEDQNSILARPFFDVTDGNTPANASQVVAAPGQRNGSINLDGASNVFGGDVSLRQRWLGGLGGFVDVLYGYQYMRVDEDLSIATSSTVLANQAIPVGTILAVRDQFDAENEFHGGQLGLAARYREGCWSFNGTLKAAAGSVKRTAIRSGSTRASLGGVTNVDPNGLLVRSTNAGTISDNTFGWVPELDATIGWRWTRNLDLTFGYHVIALTDAIQVSGTIDPDLAVNAADNPTGQQRPSGALRYDTFYIHGIHFGLQCVY